MLGSPNLHLDFHCFVSIHPPSNLHLTIRGIPAAVAWKNACPGSPSGRRSCRLRPSSAENGRSNRGLCYGWRTPFQLFLETVRVSHELRFLARPRGREGPCPGG